MLSQTPHVTLAHFLVTLIYKNNTFQTGCYVTCVALAWHNWRRFLILVQIQRTVGKRSKPWMSKSRPSAKNFLTRSSSAKWPHSNSIHAVGCFAASSSFIVILHTHKQQHHHHRHPQTLNPKIALKPQIQHVLQFGNRFIGKHEKFTRRKPECLHRKGREQECPSHRAATRAPSRVCPSPPPIPVSSKCQKLACSSWACATRVTKLLRGAWNSLRLQATTGSSWSTFKGQHSNEIFAYEKNEILYQKRRTFACASSTPLVSFMIYLIPSLLY